MEIATVDQKGLSMGKPDKYEYQALPENDAVRVLVLHPSELFEAPVQCHMVTNSLDAVRYEALSYSWGEFESGKPIYDRNITCDGADLPATRSAFEALRRLRYRDRFRRLWIDAMCINQLNVNERNHQVRQMARIFRSARRVYVWVGEDSDTEDGKVTLVCFASFLGLVQEYLESSDTRSDLDLNKLQTLLLQAYQKELPACQSTERGCHAFDGTDIWQRIIAFVQRRWFRRRWIVQEIAHAREACIICGPYELAWADFTWCLNFISKSKVREDDDTELAVIRSASGLSAMFPLDIFHWLYAFDDFRCNEPHDLLYAFLSLDFSSIMRPDYNMDITEVFTLFAEVMVQQGRAGSLLLIAALQAPDRYHLEMPRLPSWVPDWRVGLCYKHLKGNYASFSGVG